MGNFFKVRKIKGSYKQAVREALSLNLIRKSLIFSHVLEF